MDLIKELRKTTPVDVWKFCMSNVRVGREGATLCHVAASQGQWDIYKFFCIHGANPHTVDVYSLLPSEVAQDCGYVSVACAIRLFYETTV